MKMTNGVFKFAALTLALCTFASIPINADAAAKRPVRRGGGGGGGGGVMLQTPEPNTPIEHNNRAVELGSKGLWPDAIREHEEALRADPNNKEFRTNLSAAQLRYGDVLAGRRDYYNAIKQYRGALYVDPNNTPADQNLDNCLKHIGKNPDELRVRRAMAEDAEVSGDYETAIVEFRKCVKMADNGSAHFDLGRVLQKAGKIVDAYNEYKIAVNKDWPGNDGKKRLGECHRELGDILKEYAYKAKETGRGTVGMKRLVNASIEYRRAVQLNPADVNAARGLVEVAREAVNMNPSYDNHLLLGGAYLLAGDFEHAKMEYEDCFNVSPNAASLPVARRAYYLAVVKSPTVPPDLLAKTRDKIYSQLQKSPGDAELNYLYGRAMEGFFERTKNDNDKQAALQAYQSAWNINQFINPDLKLGLSRLGAAGFEQQTATSRPKQPVAPAKPKEPDDTAKNLLAFAEIEKKIRGGDIPGAQQQLNDICQKNPKEAHAWLLLGNTHEKANPPDLDQAAVCYRQAALLKDPDADSALRQVNTSRVQPAISEAEKAIEEKNYVKAASSLREAASIGPNLAFVHRKLADVLRQLGDTKEADRELKKAGELDK